MKYIFLCIWLSSFVAYGQGSLHGVIKEEGANQFLSGAYVVLKGTPHFAISNEQGAFHFNSLPAGTYSLEVSFVGYQSLVREVQIVNQQPLRVELALPVGTVQLADVVISASPSLSVNVLSPVDIKLRPANTSQDVLRMVPGLFIAQHAGGGKAEQIFLRGFDIDHGTDINLEVDGLPVNMVSHAHGQGYSDLHFVIPELVSLVDFDKGPYYADKGDFTTAGFVSFKTKNRLEQNFVKAEGGQYGTARIVTGINLGEKVLVAGEYFYSDGYFESPQDFNRLNLSGKYTSSLNSKTHLNAGLSYFTSSWNASGQIPERAVKDGTITRFGSIDDSEGGETSRANAFVKLSHAFSDRTTFEQQVYAIYYDFNLYSNFTFYLNDPVNGDEIQQKESRMIYGYKGTYHHDGMLDNAKLRTNAGVGFRYDDVDNISLSNAVKRTFLNDVQRGNVNEMNLNAFLDETLTLNQHWSVNAALRFDYFNFAYDDLLNNTTKSSNASMLSPKLTVNYQVNDKLLIYLRNGFGFHSNDARVVIGEEAKDALPRAFGTDVGVQAKISDKLLVNVAFWQLNLKQEFVYVGDAGIVEPSGETQRQGVDVSLRYQVLPWLFTDVDFNLTNPKAVGEPEGEDYLPLAPTQTSIGGLSWKLQNGFNGSLRYRYIKDRAANEDNTVVADGYFLSDLVFNYTQKKYEIGFSIENIFNAEWKEAQFDTESRLFDEPAPVSEIHYTPGIPFFAKARVTFFF